MANEALTCETENVEIISRAFQKGLDSQEIVALHGTSLYVLKRILETGFQPGVSYPDGLPTKWKGFREGDVFVYPVKGRVGAVDFGRAREFDKALREAGSYAGISAPVHYLSGKLGFSLTSAETESMRLIAAVLRYDPETALPGRDPDRKPAMRAIETLVGKGIDRDFLEKAVAESRKKKGLVIGYSRGIFDEGQPLPGDRNDEARVQNVRIAQVIGIEPLDDEAYDFLDSL